MDVTAEAVEAVYAARGQATGLAFTYEPRYLRFFQARFEPIKSPTAAPLTT
jgi:tyrosine phenol-lyase